MMASRKPGDRRHAVEQIREAAHEVQRPVFYLHRDHHYRVYPHLHAAARGRAAVQADGMDGRFRTVGGLMFSMFLAPVLASFLFRKGTKEWHNPLMALLTACM